MALIKLAILASALLRMKEGSQAAGASSSLRVCGEYSLDEDTMEPPAQPPSPALPPPEPAKGLPPVTPPSGRFIAQLFFVPGLIVAVAVLLLLAFRYLFGGTQTPE